MNERKKIMDKLSRYSTIIAEKPIYVTTHDVLPPNIRNLIPKRALTDGNRIYLEEPNTKLKAEEQEEHYKRECLEKILEIKEGYFSLPKEDRPSFEKYEYKETASTIFHILEGEHCHQKAKKQFPNIYGGVKEENVFLKNFVQVSKQLPRRKGRKLRKYASRYSRLTKKGKGDTNISVQYTDKIYKLLETEIENKEDYTEFLKFLSSLFGFPGSGGDINEHMKKLGEFRDEIISKILEDRKIKEMKLFSEDIEKKIDEMCQENSNFHTTSDSITNTIIEEKKRENKDQKYVPNPYENSCQEEGLEFREKDVFRKNGGENIYSSIREKNSTTILELKRIFEKMRGEESQKVKKQISGCDIDLDNAINFMVSLRNNEQPDERVYRDVKLNRRDVCCGLLIDASGSMGNDKIEKAKETSVILSEAIDNIGDDFAIRAFSGEYPVVEIYKIKDFGERISEEVKKRIGSLKSLCQNRDGAAIRYMTDYISHMPNKTKILFVVSDGSPADGCYPNAIKDTRKALLEAKARGIHTYCITVDKNAKDYIDTMYGESGYCICTNPTELSKKAVNFYKEIAFK